MSKSKNFAKKILKRVFKNHSYTSKYDLIKGMKIVGDLGFLQTPVLSEEDRFLLDLNFSDQVIYDVGAHIGIMSLFFSTQAYQVFSFEPNPETYKYLVKNLENNLVKNVVTLNMGLGNRKEKSILMFEEGNNAIGTLEKERQEKYKRNRKPTSVLVQVIPLDELTLPLPPNFIKIDVEGFEVEVLQGMQKVLKDYKPQLLIELHGPDKFHPVVNLLPGYHITQIGQRNKFIYCE